MNNKLFNSFYYIVSNDFLSNTHRKVKAIYLYKNKIIIKPLLIKKNKRHHEDAYYINEAIKIINKTKNEELEKYSLQYIRKNRLFKIVLPIFTVCAIVGSTLGIYFAIRPISFEEDAKNMISEYQNMMIETTDTSFYDNKSISDILHDETRPMQEKEISGTTTYYFTNIEYEDLESRDDNWPAKNHLNYAFEMAISAYKSNRIELLKMAGKLISYWVFCDFRSSNWWWNEIGANGRLASTGIFCFNVLNEKAQQALLGRLEQSSFYYRPALETHTGANLIDFAEITLKSSLLRNNYQEFESAVNRMEREITDNNKEGFQKDGTFFQHGQQNQTCSYGLSILRIGNFIKVVSSSKLRKFKQNNLNIISKFILDGLVGATHRGHMNYFTMSREYVREGHLSISDEYSFDNLKYFCESKGMPQAEEIKNYIKNINQQGSTFKGLKYYDNARMIALNSDDLYMSFKGSADYLINTECNNDENKLGLNLSYGTNTCIMDNGKEYEDIIPVWDYAYMPGTTSIQLGDIHDLEEIEGGYSKYLYDSDQMLLSIKSPDYYDDGLFDNHLPNATDTNSFYYGGGYDKQNDVAYLMQKSCHHGENHFAVTCIATKIGMILLGADLNYEGTFTEDERLFPKNSRKLHTTIEQAYAKEDTSLSDNKKDLIFGNAFYRILDDSKIVIENRTVNGHWKRNHKEAAADKAVSKNIFVAYINHPDRNNAKYAYSIQHKNHQNEKFELVRNFDGNKVQEVKLPNGLYAIASYEKIDNYQTAKGEIINLKKGDFKIL